ncbi:tRNA adenosine deaminase-associated protein [Aestuariimicrobium sp. Y1814]|uniref:tRNA adenosine deaminase-associated protein n=1 Tax=Aestuariimicrobium sp. Y1814 TaxID=3418742 RepID=UPI003DA73577
MAGEDIESIDARDARDNDSLLADDDIIGFDEDEDDVDEDDLDDDSDEDDDDEDDDFIEDASDEDIDLVMAAYREDGEAVVQSLSNELANDLDELINQLRRLPGDSGAIGAVSIAGEFFVLVRVRGRNVEVLLSDSFSANDWPIARDVADFLGVDAPEDEDDSEALGDLEIFADLGLSEMDLESLADDTDEADADEIVAEIFDRLKFGAQFKRALAGRDH